MRLARSEEWQLGVVLLVLIIPILAFGVSLWYRRRKQKTDEALFWREVDKHYGPQTQISTKDEGPVTRK